MDMLRCRWCGKGIREEDAVISAYGYKVCPSECAEDLDANEHEYMMNYEPENAIKRREP